MEHNTPLLQKSVLSPGFCRVVGTCCKLEKIRYIGASGNVGHGHLSFPDWNRFDEEKKICRHINRCERQTDDI